LASAIVTSVEEVPFASLDQAPSFSCMLGNCPKVNVLYTATTNKRRNTCSFVHGPSKQKNNFFNMYVSLHSYQDPGKARAQRIL
jgi:transposase-like protein